MKYSRFLSVTRLIIRYQLYETTLLDGLVNAVKRGLVKGPLPQQKRLVIIRPADQFDMSKGAALGCAMGVEWWVPGTQLLFKMVNTSKMPAVAQASRVTKAKTSFSMPKVKRHLRVE